MSHYRERLSPSLWVFLSTALVVPASIIVFAPLPSAPGVLIGSVIGVLIYAGFVIGLLASAPVITVENGTLTVGRASIPVELVGDVEEFRGEDARTQRGPQLDARAYLCIRGWIGPVVKMRIADPQDPTPYWLVSTRRPGDLIEAVSTR